MLQTFVNLVSQDAYHAKMALLVMIVVLETILMALSVLLVLLP